MGRPVGLLSVGAATAALFVGGYAVAAVAVGESTGTVTVCATVSTPAHTVGVDGADVHTIPGASASQCETATYTVPTSTVTETATAPGTTATTTAATTTATTATTTTTPSGTQVTNAAELLAASNNPANEGQTVTLRGGSYGAVTITAARAALVTYQAAAGERVGFSSLTVSGGASWHKFVGVNVDGTLTFGAFNQSGCSNISVWYSRLQRVWATGSATLRCVNVSLRGNYVRYPILTPSTEVDLVRLVTFQNLTIEESEFSFHRDTGTTHSDVLQAYTSLTGSSGAFASGLIFRKNYIHDINAQGFFIKDWPVTNVTFSDNVVARTNVAGGSFAPVTFYGTKGLTAERNAVWADYNGVHFRSNGNTGIRYDRNTVWSTYVENSGSFSANRLSQDWNVLSDTWSLGPFGPNDKTAPHTNAPFVNAAADDYRLVPGAPNYGEAGVTWAPSQMVYGPAAVGAL